MPSASMNRLLDDAKVNLPGALDDAILAELFRVVRDFTNDTNVWTMVLEFDVQPTERSIAEDPDAYIYQLSPPTGSRCRRLLGVVDGKGHLVSAGMPRPNFIQLTSSPVGEEVYKAEVTLGVTDPVTRSGEPVVPDWVVEEYSDGILSGLLSRMMAQPAKPYSSITLATYHAGVFKSAIGTARIRADRARTRGGQAWRFPQSFNR